MATTDSSDGAKVRFPPPFVALLSILLGVALSYTVATPSIPLDRTVRIAIGVLLIVAGLVPIVAARLHFIRTGQSVMPWKPTPELIFAGPYRFTRNPMYVGLTVVQIGIGIAFDNLWISLLAAVTLAVIHVIAVRPEEAYLSAKFGEPYRNYLTRVRRYL
jgi:protein-S-isoprenylcysteine O-methyltransferase Ste14